MAETTLSYAVATGDLKLPKRPGVLEINEIAHLARYVLRGHTEAIAKISAALGLDLDSQINRAVTADQGSVLRLGPDEWLLLADTNEADGIAKQTGTSGATAYSLVEVSHRNIGFRLAGCAVADALAAGCPQALDIDRFPVDKCSRTIFAKAEIVLWRRSQQEFHLEIGRSFAPYVMEYLTHESVLL